MPNPKAEVLALAFTVYHQRIPTETPNAGQRPFYRLWQLPGLPCLLGLEDHWVLASDVVRRVPGTGPAQSLHNPCIALIHALGHVQGATEWDIGPLSVFVTLVLWKH